MSNEQLIADLKETRVQLAIRGRCRVELINEEGNVCLDGAIVAAVNGEVTDSQLGYTFLKMDPRAKAVTQALFDQVPDDHRSFGNKPKSRFPGAVGVFYFNDDETTTDEDCFVLVDKALAEAGGLL
jgi:hypothetical protein